MYQHIIAAIEAVEKKSNEMEFGSERDNHYFLEGLNVAKQVIKEVGETDIEMAYETFENTVIALKDELDKYDMEVIIEDVFMDEDLG
jgi:hypothetical protein